MKIVIYWGLLNAALLGQLFSITLVGRPQRQDCQVNDGILNIKERGGLQLEQEIVLMGDESIPLNLEELERLGHVSGAAINRNNKKFAVVIGFNDRDSQDLIVFGDSKSVSKVRMWDGRNFVSELLSLSDSGRYLFAVVAVHKELEPASFKVFYNPMVLDLVEKKTLACDYDDWKEFMTK